MCTLSRIFRLHSVTLKCLTQRFSSSTTDTVSISQLSLKEPLASHNSHTVSGSSFIEDRETKITTLQNGLRIASQDKFGMHCAIGVIVGAGPRHEVDFPSGISHYLEKLGFHSSNMFADRDAVQAAVEKCNAIFDCQISRDFIVYAVSGFNRSMQQLTQILAETVLHARIAPEEVDMAERSIRFELQSLELSPPVEPIINELVHSAAFGGTNTLGLPRYCPEQNLGKITRDDIVKFVTTYYRPERMVLAGVGVQHDSFVKAVEAAFTPCTPTVASEPVAKQAPDPDQSTAQYIGGCLKLERDLKQYHAPMPEFAHAAIGLQSCGYQDAQFVPACLLHSLLGGGGSFSAGGPGKGMYTRLYLNVLNRYHWVNSAQAENHAYADTGLFTLVGSAEPLHLDRLVYTLATELRCTSEALLPPEEICRAKAQLKSMLLMNLETRTVTFEDIARQVLTTGQRHQPEYWAERIDKVTAEDLHDLLHRMLTQSPPTLIGFGNVNALPTVGEVISTLQNPASSASNRLPHFFKRFI